MDWMSIGLLLIMLGMLFIAIGILGVPASGARAEGAAVVFIGPIPVVFASSERAAWLGLTIGILMILVVTLWLRQ